MVVNKWAGSARVAHTGYYPHHLHPDGVVTGRKCNDRYIYGDIARVVSVNINLNFMLKYLMGNNPH